MELINCTRFAAGWTLGFQPDGRELVVVIVKATYVLRNGGGSGPILSEEQQPLLEADTFGEDPANDAPIYENDFAPFKPACDVLLRATAYAPGGRRVKRIEVGLQVGGCRKRFAVVGQRTWQKRLAAVLASDPVPFESKEISYDVAFGGTDVHPDQPDSVRTYLPNPVGTGFCHFESNVDGMLLPVTEEIGSSVTSPKGKYRPVALGPIGRNWLPRYEYAGTYDTKWQEEKLPFLPSDFDNRYFQAAPADQQIPYPQGGEPIVLINLSREGRLESQIPADSVFVSFLRHRGESVQLQAKLDTLLTDPEADRMHLTWRVSYPLSRDLFELRQMIVETGSERHKGRVRARLKNKQYFGNLGELNLKRRSVQ